MSEKNSRRLMNSSTEYNDYCIHMVHEKDHCLECPQTLTPQTLEQMDREAAEKMADELALRDKPHDIYSNCFEHRERFWFLSGVKEGIRYERERVAKELPEIIDHAATRIGCTGGIKGTFNRWIVSRITGMEAGK